MKLEHIFLGSGIFLGIISSTLENPRTGAFLEAQGPIFWIGTFFILLGLAKIAITRPSS